MAIDTPNYIASYVISLQIFTRCKRVPRSAIWDFALDLPMFFHRYIYTTVVVIIVMYLRTNAFHIWILIRAGMSSGPTLDSTAQIHRAKYRSARSLKPRSQPPGIRPRPECCARQLSWKSAATPIMDPIIQVEDYRRGLALFDDEAFFEAHEVLEDIWRPAPEPERKFLQGLIQVAVGLHHHSRGNLHGCRSLLARAHRNLSLYPAIHQGVDLAGLRNALLDWTAALESNRPVPPLPKVRLRHRP